MSATSYFKPPVHQPSHLPDNLPTATVVVVGGGPVGLATALGLARRGVRVIVLEAANQVSFGSRAICVSRHSLEIADRLGFGDELTARALEWEGGRSFHRDHEVLRFKMPRDPHAVRPPMVNVSQSELEHVMAEAVEADPLITMCWGCEVTALKQGKDTVQLQVNTAAGPKLFSAAWVVAADGGQSRIRDLVGVRLQGTSYEGRYVIADIGWESDLPAERMVWFDPPSNPGSTVIMHRQPHDIWRIDYQLGPDADAGVEISEERIRERITRHLTWLQATTQQSGGRWTLEWFGFYKAHALALDDFVRDRVIFAGDAAHLVPIFGVRGLNSGMEDADTLSWTLAAVVRGAADPALLTAYAAERRDAWTQNVAAAGKSTLIMTPGGDGHRATRDALLDLAAIRQEFSHLIDPRQSTATHARRSSLTVACPVPGLVPGDPLEDRALDVNGKERSLHEIRGAGFGLYVVTPQAADLEAARALETELAAALPHEDIGVVAVDDEATVRAWLARPGEVVVVRPDGLVMARGHAADLAGLSARLTGRDPRAVRTAAPDPETLTPAQVAREQVWLTLSEALDDTPAAERLSMLTRLALVLGDRVGPDEVRTALTDVAQPSTSN